jgi:4-amino-4-deoxy-L-arabinose transferase-like glycosyltransferase
VLWLELLVLAVGLAVWLLHAGLMVRFPFQFDGGEGVLLEVTSVMARGETVYRGLNEPPYYIAPYPPVYFWLSSLFMGPGAYGFLGGRLVSALAALLLAVLLGSWLHRRAGPTAALCGVAFFLIHPLTLGWSALFRSDMLALLFAGSALMLFSRWESRPSFRCDLLTALLLSLACLTKQTFLAGFVAVGLTLLLEDWRRALRFVAIGALSLGVPLLALHLATGGRFYEQVVTGNVLPYSLHQAVSLLGFYLLASLGLLALAAGNLAFTGWRRDRLWYFYLLATLVAVAASGRAGAFYNYYVELHLALVVLAALGIAAWERRRRRTGFAHALVLLQLLVLGGALSLPPYLHSPARALREEALPALRGELPRWYRLGMKTEGLRPWLERYPGPVLAENLGNIVALGRTPWVGDAHVLFELARLGRWDPNPVLAMIERGEFALIVLQRPEDNPRFPATVLARIRERYEVVGRVGSESVLRPREALPPPPEVRDG